MSHYQETDRQTEREREKEGERENLKTKVEYNRSKCFLGYFAIIVHNAGICSLEYVHVMRWLEYIRMKKVILYGGEGGKGEGKR